VTGHDNRSLKARKASAPSRIPAARLDALIEEAIVDAYTEAEQAVGFHATIEQHVAVPFETVVLGATVTVKKIDVTVGEKSLRSVTEGASDRPSRFSSCHCRIHHRPAGNGSRRIDGGREDTGRGH
jgi:hypothetical protein